MEFSDLLNGLHKPTSMIFNACATLDGDDNTNHKHQEFKEKVQKIRSSLQSLWGNISHDLPMGTNHHDLKAEDLKEIGREPTALINDALEKTQISPDILEKVAKFLNDSNNHGLITNANSEEIHSAAADARRLKDMLTEELTA